MMTHRRMVRIALAAIVAALAWPAAPLQAQESFGLYGFGGLTNDPAHFDVERNVDYGSGVLLGGGFRYAVNGFLALRGDVSWIRNAGDETGAVNESVDFDRIYYTGKLEFALPTGSGFSPYVFAGGGLVHVRRTANNYSYAITEAAASAGIGARYQLSSGLGLFAEGIGSLYPRNTVGGNQFDKAAIAGVIFTFR